MKKSLAVVLAVMFLFSTKPMLANGTAPPPTVEGEQPSNPNVLPCLLLPIPWNIPYCLAIPGK
jgi:hypothetical protein